MEFYLPITVNKRRLHMCKLVCETNNTPPEPVFSFLINSKVNDINFISIDSNKPELISSGGFGKNVDLRKFDTKITKENGFYVLDFLEKTKNNSSEKKIDDLVISGYFNHNQNFFRLDKDVSIPRNEPAITVVIRYKHTDSKTYSYAVKFHLCSEDNLVDAAIDFGSEASQVFPKDDQNNLKLISEFKKFYKNYNESSDFWQGKPEDRLFKSIFFLHKSPGNTTFNEMPNANNGNTFVQCLLPKDTVSTTYNDLITLPNLKLVELLPANTWTDTITGNHPFTSTQITIPLSHNVVFPGILRIILNNFMYSILESKKPANVDSTKYLRIYMLMPNVYYQEKVYQIIENLYRDFEKIIINKEYSTFKGLEVLVISESDAAFLGARRTYDNNLKNKAGGHFLIIDAGKGTTDFSILKQYNVFSKYDSIYRTGIPASGHVLTYAFHEALRDFLNTKNISLTDKLGKADRSTLLRFMENLEQFKKSYSSLTVDFEIDTTKDRLDSLDDINTFLTEKLLKENKNIPGIQNKIFAKIRVLVGEIEESIKGAVVSDFVQVVLTGRGYLFEPFRNATIEMLKNNNFINDKSQIVTYDGDYAKTICMQGAFSANEEVQINLNSELIGRPVISKQPVKTLEFISFFVKWIKVISKKLNETSLDSEFFYKGIQGIKFKNINIKIGARSINVSNPSNEEKRLYFTGNGFIIQSKFDSNKLNENYTLPPQLNELVLETLFPYFPQSIEVAKNIETEHLQSLNKAKSKAAPQTTNANDTSQTQNVSSVNINQTSTTTPD